MTWLAENWIWVIFGVAFVAMHLFGHGGHGGHGGHQHGSGDGSRRSGEPRSPAPVDETVSHRH